MPQALRKPGLLCLCMIMGGHANSNALLTGAGHAGSRLSMTLRGTGLTKCAGNRASMERRQAGRGQRRKVVNELTPPLRQLPRCTKCHSMPARVGTHWVSCG